MIARAERAGLGLSIAGHVALFGVLSLGIVAASKPIVPPSRPIDVQLVDKVGLTDTAPDPAIAEPAPSVAPEVGISEADPALQPDRPEAAPVIKNGLAPPTPSVPSRPSAAAAPVKPVQPKGSRLGSNFLKGIVDRPSAGTAQAPRAAAGPAVEASLAREVLRQLKPFWHAPSGADAELLRTELSISLARDGSVTGVRALDTRGVTDSNRGQVRLHQEAAIKAVRLAAPFSLPGEFYDTWKLLEPVGFDKRLSQ